MAFKIKFKIESKHFCDLIYESTRHLARQRVVLAWFREEIFLFFPWFSPISVCSGNTVVESHVMIFIFVYKQFSSLKFFVAECRQKNKNTVVHIFDFIIYLAICIENVNNDWTSFYSYLQIVIIIIFLIRFIIFYVDDKVKRNSWIFAFLLNR